MQTAVIQSSQLPACQQWLAERNYNVNYNYTIEQGGRDQCILKFYSAQVCDAFCSRFGIAQH